MNSMCAFQRSVTPTAWELVWVFVILKDLVLMKETQISAVFVTSYPEGTFLSVQGGP